MVGLCIFKFHRRTGQWIGIDILSEKQLVNGSIKKIINTHFPAIKQE